jgi:hypothetical protein
VTKKTYSWSWKLSQPQKTRLGPSLHIPQINTQKIHFVMNVEFTRKWKRSNVADIHIWLWHVVH